MRHHATFYHDGCQICLSLAQLFLDLLGGPRAAVEFVDLGLKQTRLEEARRAGITQLPAWVIAGRVISVNPHSELH